MGKPAPPSSLRTTGLSAGSAGEAANAGRPRRTLQLLCIRCTPRKGDPQGKGAREGVGCPVLTKGHGRIGKRPPKVLDESLHHPDTHAHTTQTLDDDDDDQMATSK